MTNKGNQSTNQIPKSVCQVQRKLVPVKREDLELVPIYNSSKRRKTHHGAVGLWRGNAVGVAAKELLEAVDHHYPNTFRGVRIRASPICLTILNQLHVVIKSFMETSVDALMEEQIFHLGEDLKELETFGLDLSWAHKRLDMVHRLKFGNEPLQKELLALEESLEPLKLRVQRRWKQTLDARDLLREAKLEYDNAIDARDRKGEEMAQKFGAEYDQVLKSHLGFGMLPKY